MMDRKKTLAAIARHVTDADIVLPVYSTAFDWIDIRRARSACVPWRDGTRLLTRLAWRSPADNGDHYRRRRQPVDNPARSSPTPRCRQNRFTSSANGTYEANGGHPIPGRGAVSFAGMARSAGYKSVYEFSDLKIFEQQAGAILAEQGPVFVCLKIVSSGEQERDYSRLHGPHVRKAFKDALSGN